MKSGLDAGIAQPRWPQEMPSAYKVRSSAQAAGFGGNGGIGGRNSGAASHPEDWPDLVPLETGELPQLMPDMLGGWLGDYAAALSASTETPFDLAACLTLGALSTAAARRIRVRVKEDYFEPSQLWVLPALAPGNRKSAVEKAAAQPLREWERDQAEAIAHRYRQGNRPGGCRQGARQGDQSAGRRRRRAMSRPATSPKRRRRSSRLRRKFRNRPNCGPRRPDTREPRHIACGR